MGQHNRALRVKIQTRPDGHFPEKGKPGKEYESAKREEAVNPSYLPISHSKLEALSLKSQSNSIYYLFGNRENRNQSSH